MLNLSNTTTAYVVFSAINIKIGKLPLHVYSSSDSLLTLIIQMVNKRCEINQNVKKNAVQRWVSHWKEARKKINFCVAEEQIGRY